MPESWYLLVQDNIKEGRADVETAFVVINETEFPEFVHEEINPAACCPDHFRQQPLRHFGKHFFSLILQATAT